jgi:hypothetical protein
LGITITEESRGEIRALTEKLVRLGFEDGPKYVKAINASLAEVLGETYIEDDNAYEYGDKYNNCVNSLAGYSELLLKSITRPAAPMADDRNERIRARLEFISKWPVQRPDKQKGDENIKEALNRVIADLNGYIEQHQQEFNPKKLVELEQNFAGFRDTVDEIFKCCEEAKILLGKIVTPDVPQRG